MNINIEIDTEYVQEWKDTVETLKNKYEERTKIIYKRLTLLDGENDSPFINYIKEDLNDFYTNHKAQEEALDNLITGITSLLNFENQDEYICKQIK